MNDEGARNDEGAMDDDPDARQRRLRTLAEQRYPLIGDPTVFGCWHVVVEAIEQRWLTPGSLGELIRTVETGGGLGAQEYSIDVIGPDLVEVAFIDERYTCSRAAILDELRRLAASDRGEADPPPTTHDIAAATAVLRSLAELAAAAAAPETAAGRKARAEASATLDALAARPGDTPPPDDLRTAAAGLGPPELAQLAAGLRAFADWAQRPEPSAGARVDAVIAGLERGLGPLLERGRQAAEAETDARISASARDSIARRIHEAGAGEPGPA